MHKPQPYLHSTKGKFAPFACKQHIIFLSSLHSLQDFCFFFASVLSDTVMLLLNFVQKTVCGNAYKQPLDLKGCSSAHPLQGIAAARLF